MPRPASKNQERYLLAERVAQASYGTRASYRLRGRLDLDRLRRAIRDTMRSHPILRTEFRPQGGGFGASVRPEPDGVEVREVTARSGDPAEIQRLHVEHIFRKPASFTPRELIRTEVIHLPPAQGEVEAGGAEAGEALLTLSLHHALSDGLSITAYAGEVFARYNGEAVLPEPVDYAALIAAAEAAPEAAAQAEAARAYWLELLQGAGEARPIPHDLDAPVAPADQRTGMIRLPHDAILRTASALSTSAFTVAAALSHVVLARYSGSDDLLSTFQSSGRRGLAGDEVIGPFSNTLILRTRIERDRSFPDLVRAQREGIKGALAHESYPYHLVLRDAGVRPRFGLNWFPPYDLPRIDGVTVLKREFIFNQTDYDLDLRFMVEGDEVAVYAYHDSGRHSAERIEAILADLALALDRVAADPHRTLSTVFDPPAPLVVPTPTRVPQGRLFDDVLAHARETPDRIALVGPDGTLTYGQLDEASAALGRRLVAAGLGPGRRVAILAERGPGLVCSMLAVLRVGATMVPLDAEYPEERLRTLVGVARPDALLLPRPGPTPGWAGGMRTVLFARDPQAAALGPEAVPAEALAAGDPDAPAYILFTSGSTGTPKGLATSHRPPLNFLRWQRETFGITAEDRFTNLMGVAHDMMIRDVFAPLSVGARLAIPHQDDVFRSGRLLDWVGEQDPTVMHLTPAMGAILAAARSPGQTLPHLRAMFFGGDRLLPALTRKMADLAPGARIVNFYGATETPQAASFHVCDPRRPWRAQPIGRGIENMDLCIVGPDRRPVPPGAPGEIAVLTPFLSLGHVRGREVVPHASPGVYFTGDTGFELPSGEVMFTGRQDDQVKIRDFRVELEEVARALKAHPAARDAVVLAEGAEQPRLVAFVTGDELSEDELHAWVGRRLPQYMVPAEIVCLDALPLLPNGKVDRQALLTMPRARRARARGRAPETAMERKLAAIWAHHLELDEVSPEQSFAQLRGDSLTYVQVLLATEAEVGQLPDGWEAMPLAEIAALRSPPTLFKWVDSAMLVRALATAFVVALHLSLFPLGGSTTALFMVSGFLLGRLQLPEAFQTRSAAPFWRTLGRVLLPYVLFVALYAGSRLALGLPVQPSILTLTNDFVHYAKARAAGEEGHNIVFWYVDCLIHMLAAIALLLAANFRWRLTESPTRFALALLAAGAVLRFALPPFLDPEYLRTGITSDGPLAYLPTTHLGTLALGMCMARVRTGRQKAGMALVVTAYATGLNLTTPSESNSWAMLLAFGTLLLFVPRLPIPKGLHVVVLMVSGASLFIYLTHIQIAGQVWQRLGVPPGSVLLWLLTVASGVLLWLAWQRLADWRLRSGEMVVRGARSLWRNLRRT